MMNSQTFKRKSSVTVAKATTFRRRWEAKLIWDLEDVHTTIQPNGIVKSPTLTIDYENKEFKKKLLWGIGIKTRSGKFMVELKPRSSEDLDCEFSFVLGEESKTSAVESGIYKGKNKGNRWVVKGRKFSVPLAQVVNEEKGLYPEGTLRITVNLWITLSPEEKTHEGPFPSLPKPTSVGKKWIADLYKSGEHSDVTIKCEEEVFRCHKLILFRSSVFEKMLTSPMLESELNVITLPDLSPKILDVFLKSMYGVPFEVPSDYKELIELMDCAERYDMLALKLTCLEALPPLLSDENAGELTLAVFRYCSDYPEFQSYFKNYCQEKHSVLIKKRAYWDLYKSNLEIFI